MTDNEIIKALECCSKWRCGECPNADISDIGYCEYKCITEAVTLLNRQKAEIEKYKEYYETMESELDSFRKDQASVKFLKNRIRAEAIKEFAERLRESKKQYEGTLAGWTFTMTELDNLVKEMTEGKRDVLP